MLPASPVNGTSLMLIEAEDCVGAVVKVTVTSLGLGFGILGVPAPDPQLVAALIHSNPGRQNESRI